MKKKVGLKEVLHVLHADLIGKDSHRSITLTYGWMANQVGHFALGFVPTSIFYFCGNSIERSLIYVAAFWTIFEVYNALSPLYKKEYKGNGIFKVQWLNLTFDTFTDLCFFWIGGSTFYKLAGGTFIPDWCFILAIVFIAFAIRYWFLTKLYQQNALLPYPFRLSQWDAELSGESADEIRNFLRDTKQQKHFLVFGGKGKGKTRLTVGIANEVAIRHHLSTYTTFSKWVGQLQEDEAELQKSKVSLWNWLESDFLLVDDINPGDPEEANHVTTNEVRKMIGLNHKDRNIAALQRMNVAWVIAQASGKETINDWKQLLMELGIPASNISIIEL